MPEGGPSAAVSGVESDPASSLAHPSAEVARLAGRGWGGQGLQRWAPARVGQTGLSPPREASLRVDTVKPGLGAERAKHPATAPGPRSCFWKARPIRSSASSGVRPEQERCWAGARASGRGWGCLCSSSKETDRTDTRTHADSCALPSVSPLKTLLGLPSKPGWMGTFSGLVSLEHTCPSVCLFPLGLVLVRVCVCESLSRVQLLATAWTAAHQAPPSMEFSRQEYWSGLPFASPEELPNPGIEPRSPALQADSCLCRTLKYK